MGRLRRGRCPRGRARGGGRAGDPRRPGSRGQPVSVEAQRFRVPGQIQGVAQGLGGGAALGYGREVQDGEWDHVCARRGMWVIGTLYRIPGNQGPWGDGGVALAVVSRGFGLRAWWRAWTG